MLAGNRLAVGEGGGGQVKFHGGSVGWGIFRIAGRDETGQQRRGEMHFGSHAHNRTLPRRTRLQNENFRRNSRGPWTDAAEDGAYWGQFVPCAVDGERYQQSQGEHAKTARLPIDPVQKPLRPVSLWRPCRLERNALFSGDRARPRSCHFRLDRDDRAGLSEDWRGLLPDCPLVIVLGRSRFFRLDLQKRLVTRKFSYGTVDTSGFA